MFDKGKLSVEEARKEGMRLLGKSTAAKRKALNLSQDDLGEALGKSRETISEVENGRAQLTETDEMIFDMLYQLGESAREFIRRGKQLSFTKEQIQEWVTKRYSKDEK